MRCHVRDTPTHTTPAVWCTPHTYIYTRTYTHVHIHTYASKVPKSLILNRLGRLRNMHNPSAARQTSRCWRPCRQRCWARRRWRDCSGLCSWQGQLPPRQNRAGEFHQVSGLRAGRRESGGRGLPRDAGRSSGGGWRRYRRCAVSFRASAPSSRARTARHSLR